MFETPKEQIKAESDGVKRNERIASTEIAELEAPLRLVIEQILSKIEAGHYSTIIGVDASGRIPTLVISRFIKHVYGEFGLEDPRVIFIAGMSKNKEVEKYLDEIGLSAKEGVLLVEDTLVTGSSVESLTQALNSRGINFDFATVGAFVYDNVQLYKDRIKHSTGADNVYFGSKGQPLIYKQRHLGGVRKQDGDLFSTPIREEVFEETKRENVQKIVNEAREDVKTLVNKLVKWYESKK